MDSPTASATGGTINYRVSKPTDEMGMILQGSLGSYQYKRLFARIDSGRIGALGTAMFVAGSIQDYDKFKGPDSLNKKQVNIRIYQPIGADSFVSIAGHYNQNRNAFYRNPTLAQIRTSGHYFENRATFFRPVAAAGSAQVDNVGTAPDGTAFSDMTNYFALRNNPSNTGNIRVQSKFLLTDAVTLTVDPSYQYVLANGGGYTLVREDDARLRGTSALTGVDLNGDGDVLDTVGLYTPNNTNTNRYSVNTSLIWEINDRHRLRLAYTFDYGRHRQTGEAGFIGNDGTLDSVFGGRNGQAVKTADGNILRTRDRFSIAQLNQVSGEYRLTLMDERLRLNAGIRAPFFKRELNQNCYTIQTQSAPTSPGVLNQNQYCTTVALANLPANLQPSASNIVLAPYKAERSYDSILPNVGVSFKFADHHQVYASYAKGFSNPRTDNLYGLSIPNAAPETSNTVDAGYRFNNGMIQAELVGYYTRFKNRIVSSFDADLGLTIDRNVGDVDSYGIDAQFSARPTESVALYVSASYNKSKVLRDLEASATVAGKVYTYFEPTRGKVLPESPEVTVGARAEYIGSYFMTGLQAKLVSERFSTDVNDERAPAYTTLDWDFRFDLGKLVDRENTYLQFNITNLLDELYLGSISSRTRALPLTNVQGIARDGTTTIIASAPGASAPTYGIGAPRTFQATLRVGF